MSIGIYKNISQYAKAKKCGRPKIYKLIEEGKIVTEEVGGIMVIDMAKYGDLDINAKPPEEETDVKSLIKSVSSMKKKIRELEHIVLSKNEAGRSKANV
jgi:uncharacterized protein YjfI (DUF2170 family)